MLLPPVRSTSGRYRKMIDRITILSVREYGGFYSGSQDSVPSRGRSPVPPKIRRSR